MNIEGNAGSADAGGTSGAAVKGGAAGANGVAFAAGEFGHQVVNLVPVLRLDEFSEVKDERIGEVVTVAPPASKQRIKDIGVYFRSFAVLASHPGDCFADWCPPLFLTAEMFIYCLDNRDGWLYITVR